jgi:hypothetical protein
MDEHVIAHICGVEESIPVTPASAIGIGVNDIPRDVIDAKHL